MNKDIELFLEYTSINIRNLKGNKDGRDKKRLLEIEKQLKKRRKEILEEALKYILRSQKS